MQSEDFLIQNSILYRCTQKYYDQELHEYNIGYGQAIFLTMINENEGSTMIELAKRGSFDKATITKAINKLEGLKYVRLEDNPLDKRSKLIYTTHHAKNLISKIYLIRKEWWQHLLSDNDYNEEFLKQMELMVEKAQNYTDLSVSTHFYKIDKFTLTSYPNHYAVKLYTGGCNLKCPFCNEKNLVFLPENSQPLNEETLFQFLNKRKSTLDSIVISGGEPLINEGLPEILKEMKALGYLIKIETNGTYPDRLKYLVKHKLVDYVSMDIKNDRKHYSKTCDVDGMNMDSIDESIQFLLENHVEYEFKTTIVKEYHNEKNIESIGKWIQGANKFIIQNFINSENCIKTDLHSESKEVLNKYQSILKQYIEDVQIRG